jgi:hypothetical protein
VNDRNLRIRTIVAEDESFDRVGEAITAVAVGHGVIAI